ncbi:MAG: hypothetical protein KUG74_08650 [Rhodobacteraceae bacterium]|nr:hypothetical protein [Paracoccaceae bacterium]
MGNKIKTTAEAYEESALPEAYSVQVTEAGETIEQNQPLPEVLAKKSIEEKSPAEWAYDRMVLYIHEFEKQLDKDHEVGMGFTGGDEGSLRIQGMGYFAPDLITFYGTDPNGAKTQLVQHVNQLSVMLVAAPKEAGAKDPNRIGFKLATQKKTQTKV